LCAISRQLDIGGAPIAAAKRADATNAGVHGLHFDNYFDDAPQPPEPRSLRTATRRVAAPPGHELRLTIDSGASFHVVNNPHYLINARPTDETISGVDRRGGYSLYSSSVAIPISNVSIKCQRAAG
jgi:hypothetical protein